MRRGFAPSFVNYKKGCTRLAAASDQVYQLLAHGRWFSPASSTTNTGHHDIAEILLKVALNTKNQSINLSETGTAYPFWTSGFSPVFWWSLFCCSVKVFCVVFVFYVFVMCLVSIVHSWLLLQFSVAYFMMKKWFQKCVLHTKLEIYVFITQTIHLTIKFNPVCVSRWIKK